MGLGFVRGSEHDPAGRQVRADADGLATEERVGLLLDRGEGAVEVDVHDLRFSIIDLALVS